jgi:hypothetical protein
VEDVVAEGVRDDVTLYLVKWRGYGWHRYMHPLPATPLSC